MKFFSSLLFGVIFTAVILQTNVAFSFSIKKAIPSPELVKYAKGSEFVKLSFKQFAMLTGQNENLWNRISFNIMKNKVKRDIRKDPNLNITRYYSRPGHAISTAGWILYGLLILLLILLIAMGIALKK